MSEQHKVVLPAGTVVKLCGVPVRLEADTVVYSATIAQYETVDDFLDAWATEYPAGGRGSFSYSGATGDPFAKDA